MRRFLIALILFLLLSTYNIQKNFSLFSNFQIKKIILENNIIINEKKIKDKLSFLYGTSLFLLQTNNIKEKLKEEDFIESFEIKKIYPNKIKIKITEKKPIAILQNKKEKKYYTNNGEIINFANLKKFKDLPTVFGDQKSFNKFYNDLKKTNFPIEEIQTFFLFDAKRWDIVTIKNQVIKLPVNNYDYSLENFMLIKNHTNFEKYKIFDYRIENQLILK